ALALASGDPAVVDAARAVKKEGDVDPWAAWMAGVALERVGAADARAYFEAALAAEPKLMRAEIQLDRWLILEGETKAADARIAKLPEGDASRSALEALSWARARATGASATPAPKLSITSADLPKALHPVFVAATVMSLPQIFAGKTKKPTDASPEAQRAIDEADSPGLAVTFGYFALWRADGALATGAMKRAATLAPSYAPTVTLAGKAIVALGKLDVVDPVVASLPADLVRPLVAAVAYERGNLDALTKLAATVPPGGDPAGAIATRIARLRGTSPLSDGDLDKLIKADALGDLCAVDAWLDAGALDRASAVVASWPNATENPLYAVRVARLRRYQGKLSEAANALDVAPASPSVQVERVLIELAADDPSPSVFSLIDDRVGGSKAFLQAYAYARTKDGDKAQRILDARSPPPFDAPLGERIVAALAYASVKDETNGAPMARVLLEKFPKNPDVVRIGKAFRLESN
ncbi:MAG TPA: hypothetical protein VL400_23550, partial [Polyangiaceae bacterium]|nr:hypothetical protein [Polyangiaceae bacterium]